MNRPGSISCFDFQDHLQREGDQWIQGDPGVRVQGRIDVGVPRGASRIRPRARDRVHKVELDFEKRVKNMLRTTRKSSVTIEPDTYLSQ